MYVRGVFCTPSASGERKYIIVSGPVPLAAARGPQHRGWKYNNTTFSFDHERDSWRSYYIARRDCGTCSATGTAHRRFLPLLLAVMAYISAAQQE